MGSAVTLVYSVRVWWNGFGISILGLAIFCFCVSFPIRLELDSFRLTFTLSLNRSLRNFAW